MGAVLVAGWMAGIRIAETRTAQRRIIGGEGSWKDRGRIAEGSRKDRVRIVEEC